MIISILGAGNGGYSAAAELSLAGHQIKLYELPEFEEKIIPVQENGGIQLFIDGYAKFAKIDTATTDIKEALEGSEAIIVMTVANAHYRLAQLCAPYVQEEQMVFLVPGGSGGALEFSKALTEAGASKRIKVSETSTLPYATRTINPGQVRIKHKVKWFLFATFPGKYTDDMYKTFHRLFPDAVPATDVLETSLNNGNPVTHTAASILSASAIEKSNGNFYLYRDAITPSVSRAIEALDNERVNLCRYLGYDEYSSLYRLYRSGYATTEKNLYDAYTTSEVFTGQYSSRGPESLQSRYITEDIGFGLVFWSSLADLLGVSVPTMKCMIHLASLLNNVDYKQVGKRTAQNLGLSGKDKNQLRKYLHEGEI